MPPLLEQARVDQDHANPKKAWINMGMPQVREARHCWKMIHPPTLLIRVCLWTVPKPSRDRTDEASLRSAVAAIAGTDPFNTDSSATWGAGLAILA